MHGAVRNDCTDGSDQDGAHWADETGGGRDGDQADDRTGARTDGGDFAATEHLEECPGQHCGCGTEVGGNEGVGGETVCAQGATGVETEPAEPEQADSKEREWNAVWGHGNPSETASWPKDDRGNQGATPAEM